MYQVCLQQKLPHFIQPNALASISRSQIAITEYGVTYKIYLQKRKIYIEVLDGYKDVSTPIAPELLSVSISSMFELKQISKTHFHLRTSRFNIIQNFQLNSSTLNSRHSLICRPCGTSMSIVLHFRANSSRFCYTCHP